MDCQFESTILLLLETGYGTEEADADCLDALAEALYSVSQELLSQQIIHSIGWQNHEESNFSVCGNGNRGRFERTAAGIAGGRTGQRWHECCRSLYGKPGAAGICTYGDFFTGASGEPGVLASQCILTEVICSGEAAGYDQQDGIAILGGTPENLPETLSYLEI